MNVHNRLLCRSVVVGVVAALAVSTAAATAAPVFGATTSDPPGGAEPATRSALPPLNRETLSAAIAGLPNDSMTGAMVDVSGSSGELSDTSGVGDIHANTPVPADGRFRIGSVTKVFTAVIVLQLDAEGTVDLDHPVQRYLPGALPATYPNIAVGQLLDHTSGLPEAVLPTGDDQWYAEHRFDSWTPREVVDSATRGRPELESAPGEEQRYSAVNYFLAGMLVERVTGNSYALELHRRITHPLKLRDTYLPGNHDFRLPRPHARGYVMVKGEFVDITAQSVWPWAEGGMISSSSDLRRFMSVLFRGHLLPRAQLAEMFTVPPVDYTGEDGNCVLGSQAGKACFSMGLTRIALSNGVTVWGKTGGRPGYSTAVFATRDLARVVVYSLNPVGNKNGAEAPYVGKIVAATLDPDVGAAVAGPDGK